MRAFSILVILFSLSIIHVKAEGIVSGIANSAHNVIEKVLDKHNNCDKDVHNDFYEATFDFGIRLYKKVGIHYQDHFVVSQLSIWLGLAAIAEGLEGVSQKQLFKALNLPEERCLREKYYQIALSRDSSKDDVKLDRKRIMLVDQSLKLNTTWLDFVEKTGILKVSSAPINTDAEYVNEQFQKYIAPETVPKVTGNAIIFDTLDYEALWTTAFPEASIVKEPFYDDDGKQIGMVDYMKIKRKVKLAHVPLLNAKVLDLPVGENGRYHMLFTMGIEKRPLRDSIEMLLTRMLREVLETRKESLIPLDVAIPRFKLNFQFEASECIEEVVGGSVWKIPEATGFISEPALQPTGYYQRVSSPIEPRGLDNSESTPKNSTGFISGITGGIKNVATKVVTGLAAVLGRDFIANRPFMFGLFDVETETVLMGGAFSKPYYPIEEKK